jgi:glycosyltransferase involved in cell wall biosynthesis
MLGARKTRNVLALTTWSYKDALVQSAVLPYLRMIRRQLPPGSKIFLLTLEQAHLAMGEEEARRERRRLEAEGVRLVAFPYSRFGPRALVRWAGLIPRLWALCLRERVRYIHAWCTPAGGAGYILSKLTGAPLVIDSYEPHAESMIEVGHWNERSLGFRILFLLEKLQTRRLRAAIATSRGVREYAERKYGVRIERFYVKPAGVDMELFTPRLSKDPALLKELGLEGKLVCVYAGKIGGIYLEREIFDFFRAAADRWGERFRVLLLTDAADERVRALVAASGLDPAAIVKRFVPFADVPRHMGLGDFALNPVRPVPTKRYCTSVKDGEYWATGLPVVIPRDISDDSEIIRERGIGAVLDEFTPEAYAGAVAEIDALLKSQTRDELAAKVRAVAAEHRDLSTRWGIYEELYGEGRAREGRSRRPFADAPHRLL